MPARIAGILILFEGRNSMMNIDNESGRQWARLTLITTLLVSIVANVTHSVLATSDVTLWLRVPGASIWPVLTFLAIEIITRIQWRTAFLHVLARVFILVPAIPAVIVSYEHQERLLSLMGESLVVSLLGPIAIDGLMIGCTLTLLITRHGQVEEAPPVAPSVPASAPVQPVLEQASRVFRRGSMPAAIAARALQDGADTAEAMNQSGLSAPAVRRYAAVVRTLRRDPEASIDARRASVRPDIVEDIRAWALALAGQAETAETVNAN